MEPRQQMEEMRSFHMKNFRQEDHREYNQTNGKLLKLNNEVWNSVDSDHE
jgi:hypothetical protein